MLCIVQLRLSCRKDFRSYQDYPNTLQGKGNTTMQIRSLTIAISIAIMSYCIGSLHQYSAPNDSDDRKLDAQIFHS